MIGCAAATPPATTPIGGGPALVVDGAVLWCRLTSPATTDTGCAALKVLAVRSVSFLPGAEAVRFFGPVARGGAYIVQTPALDTTPIPQDGRVVPLATIVDGARFACLTRLSGDDARRIDGPRFSCPPLERLSPDDVDRVEVLKPRQAIPLFGRDGAAGAVIVVLKRRS